MRPRIKQSHLLNRRSFLSSTVTGLSGIALTQLLASEQLLAKVDDKKSPIRPAIFPEQPSLARKPHFPAAAKNVIMIFCAGACSEVSRVVGHLNHHHGGGHASRSAEHELSNGRELLIDPAEVEGGDERSPS